MARSITTIIESMDAEQAAQTGLSTLNSPSNSAIYTLWKYIVAANMYLQEVLWDTFKVDIETQISKAATGSVYWLQDKIFKFQYSATTPQITTLVDFVPVYATVDSTLRIVTRCSIKTSNLNSVDIKVAKSEPPVKLAALELSSLKSYIQNGGNGTIVGAGVGVGFAGVNYNVYTYDADEVYLNAEIFYDGQYSSVIQETVLAAIDAYFKAIPFDGNLKTSAIFDAIQSVTGVSDVTIVDLAIRASATAFGSKVYLVQSSTQIYEYYPIYAGYCKGETTVANTLSDTLTYTSI